MPVVNFRKSSINLYHLDLSCERRPDRVGLVSPAADPTPALDSSTLWFVGWAIGAVCCATAPVRLFQNLTWDLAFVISAPALAGVIWATRWIMNTVASAVSGMAFPSDLFTYTNRPLSDGSGWQVAFGSAHDGLEGLTVTVVCATTS
jgi:hypothetical protein